MTDTARAQTVPSTEGRLVGAVFPAVGADGRIDGVALVTIDRPEVLNALDFELLAELADALERLDRDPDCRAIVLTGAGDRAFAAGADIAELARADADSLLGRRRFQRWDRIKRSGSRSSPRSAASPSAAAASWR